MKILLTGANGFIGNEIARLYKGHSKTIGLDTDSVDRHGNVDFYSPMVLPSPDLEGLINTFEPDLCFHCAGSASVPHSMSQPAGDFQSGPVVVFNLLDSIRKTNSRCKIIFFSSAAVYGAPLSLPITESSPLAPISPYGYHKMMCEQLLDEYRKLFGVFSIVLRVFSCYGEGLRKQLLWDMGQKIKTGELNLFGTGEETRDFIHVADVARAADHLAKTAQNGDVYNVATGRSVTIREVAEQMIHSSGKSSLRPKFNNQVKPGDPTRWQVDITRLQKSGFVPSVDLADGILKYCRWLESL